MKWIGGALVWLGCSAWGIRAIMELGRRVRLLEDLVSAMELLERELALRRIGLPELLEQLKERPTGESALLFQECSRLLEKENSFTYAWEQAVEQTPLSRTDQQLLLSLGRILGRFDAAGQVESVRRIRKELEQRTACAREEQRNLSRVYSMLGVTAGSFLALLLL